MRLFIINVEDGTTKANTIHAERFYCAMLDGMHYEGMIYRPPSEAGSILLQVTVGCSHHKCTFCNTSAGKRFRIKEESIVDSDIRYAAKHMSFIKRIFLTDGDALILPQPKLVRILTRIREEMPWIERVGLYGNVKGILRKSPEELEQLRGLGLGIVYLGCESGDAQVLKDIKKGADPEKMIEAGRRVCDAGLELSVTVLLGIAGKERSLVHARATGEVLSAMDPDFVGVLTLMVMPDTELGQSMARGEFKLPSQAELLRELREMLFYTNMTRGLFISNHASNYLPIRVRMPADKEPALATIDHALSGGIALKPEWMRAL